MTSYFYGTEILYLALFGRPTDPEGHSWINGVTDFWENTDAAIAITYSDEYQSLFYSTDDVDNLHRDMITKIYQNAFDRAPDAEGLNFYAGQYEEGEDMATIALNIVSGARGDDLDTLTHKVLASKAFTNALDTAVEIAAYAGDTAAEVGYAYLDPVNANNMPADGYRQKAEAAVELLVISDASYI
ncbi:hypothetical protein GCM10007989_15300 [Devosia pacifica]|uniref:DUF4214 domain-containing protein n=1 Tax=Devosia pacifica TaxID=1335967 RepID=A0A918S2V1_9HYPH|nr:DUF4214 domain-containing protein [Devosia pacifica]GHA21054.1 hypothetical protein GCM10007989_15300 [Devosia pacifica]